LVPKFIMADGILVKMLIKTDVRKYLDFQQIAGSYVYKGSKIHKVPATTNEAINTSLLGLLEKKSFKNMLEFIAKYDPSNPATCLDPSPGWFSTPLPLDFNTMTMRQFYAKFGVSDNTIDFTGHAIALHLDDKYLDEPAHPTLLRIQLYFHSLAKFQQSPYIYPLYGLGELPQAFARLAAIWGGTYMLHTPVDEIVTEGGKFVGVRSGSEVAKARFVIGDPSYFPDRVRQVGKVVRVICILDHPVNGTGDANSTQIIIPQNQVGRRSDIYVTAVSSVHNVAPAGTFIALVSTTVETDNPERECLPGLKLLEPIKEKFVSVSDSFVPNDDGTASQIFISSTYDATSHFETTCVDVMDIYRRVTGQELDLSPAALSASSTTTAGGDDE